MITGSALENKLKKKKKKEKLKDISILSAADQIIINDDMILFQLSSGYINRIKKK